MPCRLLLVLVLAVLVLAACGGEDAPSGPKPRPDSGFAPDACTWTPTWCYCDRTTACDGMIPTPESDAPICDCDPECLDECGRPLVDAGVDAGR
jgi:hypothetical protein